MSLRTGSPATRTAGQSMRRLRQVAVVLIFSAALMAAACGPSTSTGTLGAPSTPTATSAPTTTPTPAPSVVWRLAPGASTSHASGLMATAALAPNNVWAVGQSYVNPQEIQEQSLIERWDGSAWRSIPNPGYDYLNAVTAVSANDIWAVGGSLNYGVGYHPDKPLIEHWNGSKWSTVSSPDTHALAVELTGVAALAANDVWVVGKAELNGSLTQPLVEHWNGSAWRIVATPALANVRWSSFSTITAIPGTQQLWTVGSSVPKASNDGRVLIEKWDGAAWQIVKTPTLPQGLIAGSLNGVVALSATNAWTVGEGSVATEPAARTLVLHWDGVSWQVMTSLTIVGALMSVAAANANDVRAVGYSGDGNKQETALVLQWDGASWHRITPPTPSGAHFSALTGITTDGAGAFWAVGSTHVKGLGGTWSDSATFIVRCP